MSISPGKPSKSSPETDKTASADAPPVGPDFIQLGHILMDASQRAQPLLQEFFEKYDPVKNQINVDPMQLREAYAEFMGNMMADPQKLVDMQVQFWNDWTNLWSESAKKFLGQDGKTLYEPDKGDRRFKSAQSR